MPEAKEMIKAAKSGNAARVCAPHAPQRQPCARCSVTISGFGSGRSNTCRAM